jgi:hypothetical protein
MSAERRAPLSLTGSPSRSSSEARAGSSTAATEGFRTYAAAGAWVGSVGVFLVARPPLTLRVPRPNQDRGTLMSSVLIASLYGEL